ncbi:MAG: transglycosylase domain-containing protein [Aquabacterium sp.]
MLRAVWRIVVLVILCGLALQLYFVGRIALMRVVDPQSTAFQRTEATRILREQGRLPWSQAWRDDNAIATSLKRAVIASEDANFVDHSGVEWDALEKAWRKNSKAQARAEAQRAAAQARYERALERARQRGRTPPPPPNALTSTPKVIGGSTITQQLAKNLFLSSERSFLRKGQEFVLTFMLEGLLSKERILTVYLNNVEWGEGVFGAQAAARHYFRVDAGQLAPLQAARLAVMLPAPKRFEKQPASGYLTGRAGTIAARMGAVELP